MVFNLYAIEGYYEEISEMINISEGNTPKSNLSRVILQRRVSFITNQEENLQMGERRANIDLAFRNGLKD
ncbi:MAG: hypothetical protein IPJ37_19120 [Bacteroidales bacterium]|nr:hypothetical protein [Bacteroidales bacterium]